MKTKSKETSDATVSVATLKAELAKYLRLVEAGNEVVVLSHRSAIAKIIPFSEHVELDSIKPKGEFSEISKMKIPKRHNKAKKDSLALLLEERGER